MTKFYKEKIQLFRLCRVCGEEFRSPKRMRDQNNYLCIVHRREFHKQIYLRYPRISYKDQSPEWKTRVYQYWLQWVTNNLENRRVIALHSYHKNKYKDSNKARRHRTTKKEPLSV